MSHTPPFNAWNDKDVLAWRNNQKIQRVLRNDIVTKIKELRDRFTLTQYGELAYEKSYPLYLIQSKEFNPSKPNVLITGGVHGYETSGPLGALDFMATKASAYKNDFNFICAPCVSPWGYETINRWNPDAIDPIATFINKALRRNARFSTQLSMIWDSSFMLILICMKQPIPTILFFGRH
jgi:hypothetical protein